MGDGSIKLSVILAESKTINGKCRQIHIKSLGSINEGHINVRLKQAQFHEVADARMSALTISQKDRARIARALRARIPKPTEKQLKRETVAIEEYLRNCTKMNKIC